jgi:hypothetical protein
MVDITDLYWEETLVKLNDLRLAVTDSQGMVTLSYVTVIDVRGQNACIRYVFLSGDSGRLFEEDLTIRSDPSNLYCYRNNL